MPLRDHHQIVSVDDHLIEHPRVWQDRLPEKFKERGPRIIEKDNKHIWVYDGDVYPTVGLNAVVGKPPEEWGLDPVRYEDMIPGCYDPAARIKDMDLDGIQAAMLFPSFPGFGGGVFFRAKDKELALAGVKAWNDYYPEEWCKPYPDRFIPLCIVPFWDIEETVREVHRCAAMGARTISFPDSPVPMGLPSFHNAHWEPLWNACEETGMVISLHFGSSAYVPGFSYSAMQAVPGQMSMPDAPFAVAITLFSTNLMWSTVDLLFSGVLQRHPKLRFSLAEGGIGWIPYILERADDVWSEHRAWGGVKDLVPEPPSTYYYRQIYGCFFRDQHGIDSLDVVGVDNITFETDYPHTDSTWPHTKEVATELMRTVPTDAVEKIMRGNARRMLGLG